jgi:hypothetical protein
MDFTGCRLPYSSGSYGFGIGWGCVSFGWVGCVRYFGIEKYSVPADSKLLENSLFSPIFLPLDRGWCSWRCVSVLTDEGMVSVF